MYCEGCTSLSNSEQLIVVGWNIGDSVSKALNLVWGDIAHWDPVPIRKDFVEVKVEGFF